MKKLKVLWASDSPEILQVGQSRVTRELCYRFKALGIDIQVAGYMPDPTLFRSNPITEFPIHSWQRFETEKLIAIIQEVKPNILVLSHDPFMFNCVKHLRSVFGNELTIIGYFTIDGEPVPHVWRDIFYNCDHVVTPSQYGKRVIKERFFDVPTSVIPYAVNTTLYCCEDKAKERSNMVFGHETINCKDKVIYCYVGNNQGRKNVGVARDAFKKFVDKYQLFENVLFLLIMKSTICTTGDMKYIGYYDINEFQHPCIRVVGCSVADEIIAKLYKVSDFIVHPTNGEGWGLSLHEALASGCTPITTNFSSQTDFCNVENSIMLDYTTLRGDFDVYRSIVDENHLVEQLHNAYQMVKGNEFEKSRLQRMRKNGIETAGRYSWDVSAQQFVNLFTDVSKRKVKDANKLKLVRL